MTQTKNRRIWQTCYNLMEIAELPIYRGTFRELNC